MMSNALIVRRDLDTARRSLGDATEHLGYLAYGDSKTAELSSAIKATISAIQSVAASVERLAELPFCEGGHDA